MRQAGVAWMDIGKWRHICVVTLKRGQQRDRNAGEKSTLDLTTGYRAL
jgi:hypothetical protein